jgi:hypothetical protein
MGIWIDVGSGHIVQCLPTDSPDVVTLLWEHDTLPGYTVPRHMIGSKAGATWSVIRRDPLSLSPSLHCDRSLGGCGMHGFITDGTYR